MINKTYSGRPPNDITESITKELLESLSPQQIEQINIAVSAGKKILLVAACPLCNTPLTHSPKMIQELRTLPWEFRDIDKTQGYIKCPQCREVISSSNLKQGLLIEGTDTVIISDIRFTYKLHHYQ
jgi:uncharacterized protein YbaR (Trm112 family)